MFYVFYMRILYTLEVQPPLFMGWFPNHHFLSKGLSSSKWNFTHFQNGGNDFPGRPSSRPAIFVPPTLRLKELTGDTGSSGLGTQRHMKVKWGPEKRVISGVTMGPPNLHSKKSPTGPTERTPKPE